MTGTPRPCVCVIGAGFAGLQAATTLAERGADVRVVEARDRVGGRVHSTTLPDGSVIELGAEFILPGYTRMRGLLAELGLGLWDKGMRYGDREPRGVDVDPRALAAAYRTVGEAVRDHSPNSLSVPGLLDQLELDPTAREVILARVEISAAKPPADARAAALEHLAAADQTPCPSVAGGNQRLADALAARLGERVMLERPVHRIEVTGAGVRVAARDLELTCDGCVVALPAPVARSLELAPALPTPHRAELDAIRPGHAAKLFVPARGIRSPSALMHVPERYWTWTATGADDRVQPVVCAFAGGSGLERLQVDRGPERWLDSLARLRPELELDLPSARLATWRDDPWSLGAYTTPDPGGPGRAALTAGLPRLTFCGEYLDPEFPGLMEGALRSGERAALQLLDSIAPG